MKKCTIKNKIVISIVFLVLLVFGFRNKIINYFGLNDFSISFWINVDSQRQGEKYLTLSDGHQELNLLAHLQDENGLEKGLTLSHDNGEIYAGKDFLPELDTYSFIVINYHRNVFELYLNGDLVGDMIVCDSFDSDKMKVNFIVDEGLVQDYLVYKNSLSSEEIIERYNKNKQLVLYNIDYDDSFKKDANGKVSLPLTRKDVKYISSDENYLTIDNNYLFFSKNNTEQDVKVSLICLFENVKKEIDFIIKTNNEQTRTERAIQKLINMFQSNISESDIFPSVVDGFSVNYKSLNDNVEFINNKFINMTKDKIVPLDIEIEVNNRIINIATNLIEEYYGYLITYFSGQAFWPEYATGTEKINFSITRDLKTYDILNNIKIGCDQGSNRFRDPFISRVYGSYIMLSTQAYYHPEIYITRTDDFSNYSTDLVNITDYSFDINLSGNYSWGSEFFYDKEKEQYVVIYSDPEQDKSCIYAVTTKDFISFSFPYVFFNAGYKVIDPTICIIDGNVCLFYKDEREDNYRICYAISNKLTDHPTWVMYDDENSFYTKQHCEGPFIIKNFADNNYYLYVDSYGESKSFSTKLIVNEKKFLGTLTVDKYINTIKDLRHFSIIPITEAEYNMLYNIGIG